LILTVVFWVGYFYLMRHALSVVLSYFGISAPWGLQFNDVSVPPILNNIQIYAVIVVLNTIIFLGWALYNKYMFGSRNRRRNPAAVTPEEVANFFSLTPLTVNTCRAARRMVMVHDDAGKLIQCDSDKA
jgi:poly-beta-1,6-N-acetyl-D-glucosamine biosynthesis protein PgaD